MKDLYLQILDKYGREVARSFRAQYKRIAARKGEREARRWAIRWLRAQGELGRSFGCR